MKGDARPRSPGQERMLRDVADVGLKRRSAALLKHLALDGLDGEVSNVGPPIVDVTPAGNYIIQGKRVTDAEALSQMSIPDHETCVEVTRSAMARLFMGG